jgi:hypothetical protein
MVTIEQVIKFLMDLMRDDQHKAAFNADPAGTLAERGLGEVTPRDIDDAVTVMGDSGLAHAREDATPLMGDSGPAHPRGGGSAAEGHENSIDAIRHVSTTYVIDQHRSVEIGDIHEEFTIVDIDVDDRDVSDSYNGDEHIIAIQDNDTVNNDTDVDVVNVEDSFNDESTPPVEEPNSSDEIEPNESLPDAEPSVEPEPVAAPSAEQSEEPDPVAEPSSGADPEPVPEPSAEPDPVAEPVEHDPVLSGSDAHVDYDDADGEMLHADAPVM